MSKEKKKIFLDSEDDVQVAIKKIGQTKDSEIVLNVPKDSPLGVSLNHFQLVRQKAIAAGKKILVESVDDHILELAEISGLESVNPIFKTRGRPVTDILPVKITRSRPAITPKEDDEEKDVDEEVEREPTSFREVAHRDIKNKGEGSSTDLARFAIKIGFLVSIVGLVYWTGFFVLPKAYIVLELKQYPASINERVLVGVNIPKVSSENDLTVIPGEVLKSVKNVEMNFPAEKKESTEHYAEGVITIYNAYSGESQALVAKTRFQTVDGKIFRLKDKILVPGAEVVNGKVKPAGIDAYVVADKAGSDYNIGSIDKWTIPGFRGSNKYDKFYGVSVGSMKGGVVGMQAAPTEAEITEAKKKVRDSLMNVLKNEVSVLMSDAYEVLPGTTKFELKREDVYPTPGSETNFSVFMEAELVQLVFNKDSLEEALVAKSKAGLSEGIDYKLRNLVFDYENSNVDLINGEINFLAKGSAVFESGIKTGELTANLLGKTGDEARELVLGLPGLEKAKISLTPFWVRKVPESEKKIEITVK